MKNILLLLLICATGASCSKLVDGKAGDYTFTGTLFKDCNRTPIANAKIVYTTFRGSSFSPLTRSFTSQTDANGRFSITETSESLNSITIELASPPNYEDGPVIGKLDTRQVQNDVMHDFGELFVTNKTEQGNSKYYAELNLKIDPYFQQFDSLVLGLQLDSVLILKPVPARYTYTFTGFAGPALDSLRTAYYGGTLRYSTSLQDYRNSYGINAIYSNVFKSSVPFSLCTKGVFSNATVDTSTVLK